LFRRGSRESSRSSSYVIWTKKSVFIWSCISRTFVDCGAAPFVEEEGQRGGAVVDGARIGGEGVEGQVVDGETDEAEDELVRHMGIQCQRVYACFEVPKLRCCSKLTAHAARRNMVLV